MLNSILAMIIRENDRISFWKVPIKIVGCFLFSGFFFLFFSGFFSVFLFFYKINANFDLGIHPYITSAKGLGGWGWKVAIFADFQYCIDAYIVGGNKKT